MSMSPDFYLLQIEWLSFFVLSYMYKMYTSGLGYISPAFFYHLYCIITKEVRVKVSIDLNILKH